MNKTCEPLGFGTPAERRGALRRTVGVKVWARIVIVVGVGLVVGCTMVIMVGSFGKDGIRKMV